MAAQNPPFVLQNASHGSEVVRRELQSGLPLGSAGGVVPATVVSAQSNPGDLQVSAPVSGMTVNVAPGQAIVPGTLGSGSGYGMPLGYGMPVVTLNGGSAPTVATGAHATVVQMTTQGCYYVYNDNSSGAVSLAIASSNPSNPRIDVVIAQVEDAQYSGSNNDWKLAVVTGTAAASPTVPSLPANSLVLAYVWIPAASTNVSAGNILDLRVNYNRNPYRAEMYRNATYTQSSASATTIPYDTVVDDPTAGCATGSGASFTCLQSGRWLIETTTVVTPTSGDRVNVSLLANGSVVRGLASQQPNGVQNAYLTGSTTWMAKEGDFFNVQLTNQVTNTIFVPGQSFVAVTFTLQSAA